VFQSTSTESATPEELAVCDTDKFQSTRPQGARRKRAEAQMDIAGFNPRAHRERDKPD